MPDVLVEKKDYIGTVTFNRPDRMNTISGAMLSEFSQALVEMNADPDVRVIVITGAGRAFCAGLDLQDQNDGKGFDTSKGGVGQATATIDLRDAPPTVLHNVDKPTICALNGGAAGYGMDLALGCDIRIASDAAKMSAAFTKRGVIPESGGTWLLPKIVGWSLASEIMFTGRRFSADEALAMGLVNQVVPVNDLEESVHELAATIAGNAPLTIRASKTIVTEAMKFPDEQNLDLCQEQVDACMDSADFAEGRTAFMEKRTPKFIGK